jgi:hypothetical protein
MFSTCFTMFSTCFTLFLSFFTCFHPAYLSPPCSYLLQPFLSLFTCSTLSICFTCFFYLLHSVFYLLYLFLSTSPCPYLFSLCFTHSLPLSTLFLPASTFSIFCFYLSSPALPCFNLLHPLFMVLHPVPISLHPASPCFYLSSPHFTLSHLSSPCFSLFLPFFTLLYSALT